MGHDIAKWKDRGRGEVVTLSNRVIRDALQRLGHRSPEQGVLHILGVRGAVPAKALARDR